MHDILVDIEIIIIQIIILELHNAFIQLLFLSLVMERLHYSTLIAIL